MNERGPLLQQLFDSLSRQARESDQEVLSVWTLTEEVVPTSDNECLPLLVENPWLMQVVFGQEDLQGDETLGWVLWTVLREEFMDYFFHDIEWTEEVYS